VNDSGRKELTDSTFERVRNVASDIFGIPANQITAESSPETIDNWDSMQHLNLVLAIEEKFGVQLDPEDIEEMKNIGAIAALVEKLQSAAH
jgi:acyl carrier protein